MPKNKVRFNLKNVHYATATYDCVTGITTYGTPVKFPGAIALTLDPVGDITDTKADGVTYYLSSLDDGYEGSFEVAAMLDQFLIDIMAYVEDDNNALVQTAFAEVKEFALGFEIQGDKNGRRIWVHRCVARKAGIGSATIENSKENQNQSFDLRAPGRLDDNLVKISIEPDGTNDTAYNEFFDAVYVPVITP